MSNLYWIHCNLCNALPSEIAHYFLSCSHILCKNCIGNEKELKSCIVCKKSCRIQSLSNLSGEVKTYFQPIETTLEVPIKTIKFQQAQQQRQFKLTKDYKAKCEKMDKIIEIEKARAKKAHDEYVKTRQLRILMQQKILKKYKEDQKKKESEKYRQSMNLSLSSASSMENSAGFNRSISIITPHVNRKIPQKSASYSNFFDSSPETSLKGIKPSILKLILNRRNSADAEKSQANRGPFFA